MNALRGLVASLVIGIATAVAVVGLAIIPFLNPVWVGFEQDRAQALAWTGFSPVQLSAATNEILADLVLGPPDFDVRLDGVPVLVEREREHMRDVRSVFAGFYVVAAGCAVLVLAAFAIQRGPDARRRLWRRLAGTGTAIVLVTVVGGAAGVLFFDAAFEIFHRLFFPAGTYLFDPRTDRLVQLFPEQFWVETTIGVGIVVIGLGLALRWLGRRRSGLRT
jgi:integral membrane protein (TIGR01906 family)